MTIKEIIDGLKFTVEMFLFDPTTGETYKEPRNDMDKTTIDACNGAIELLEQTRWIPCSEKLPKENEYIGDVCKYYLIQDEYGDMHVAHLSNVGWIPMDAFKAIGNEIIAWRELPESYKPEKDVNCTDLCKSCNTKGCIFQSGIVRTHCDFYKAESEDKEMSKITIYGKKSAVALETIDNVEEHYCTNGMFYVKAEGQEYYFSLEAISMIRVETESEVKDIKWEYDSKDVLDKIRAEIKKLPDLIWNYDAIDIIDKYKAESEDKMGRLIDVDEVKKRYPIMENDFGMVINESLHKELDKIPTVEAVSKADIVVILGKIRAEIEALSNANPSYWHSGDMVEREDVLEIIDKYKAESEEE